MLHGHPIAKELEQWFRDNSEEGSEEWSLFLADLQAAMAVKFAEQSQAHSNGGRFGMSGAGGPTRATSLKFLGHEPEPFTGSDKMTFFIGHLLEVVGIVALKHCGYHLSGAAQAPVVIDPMMHSYSDELMALVKGTTNIDTILSVKTAGYKKSGKQGGKWVRRGFPELPFEGVRKAHPAWYAQAQAEMHGSAFKQTIVLVISKDIIKSMKDDPFLGPEGNGSLTFYAELIPYDPAFCLEHLIPVWESVWQDTQDGVPGRCWYLNADRDEYIELATASTSWMPNAERTGSFNPCSYCDMFRACLTQKGSN